MVLDPSLTKTQSREVRELRQELEKAGMVKAMQQRAALLPLFEKTGRLKLPAVRYSAQDFVIIIKSQMSWFSFTQFMLQELRSTMPVQGVYSRPAGRRQEGDSVCPPQVSPELHLRMPLRQGSNVLCYVVSSTCIPWKTLLAEPLIGRLFFLECTFNHHWVVVNYSTLLLCLCRVMSTLGLMAVRHQRHANCCVTGSSMTSCASWPFSPSPLPMPVRSSVKYYSAPSIISQQFPLAFIHYV